MANGWEHDFDWQRAYIPAMKVILANYLITEASADEDQTHNTDLVVLTLDRLRVACRIRTHKYVRNLDYRNQFTIRASRPSGTETELAKVLAGWGDYILYGFAGEHGNNLCAWMLGDLRVFRLWHHRQLALLPPRTYPGQGRSNGDGSSTFRAYQIDDLPDDFIIARKPYVAHDRGKVA